MNCRCPRCRRLPTPLEVGDAHEVAIILHLDLDSAHALLGWTPPSDSSHRELADTIARYESLVTTDDPTP